jgi:hypothetical protein
MVFYRFVKIRLLKDLLFTPFPYENKDRDSPFTYYHSISIVFIYPRYATLGSQYFRPQNISPSEMIPSDSVFHFKKGNEKIFKGRTISLYSKGATDTIKMNFEDYLREKTTITAFLVIRNDSIFLYEQYFRGYKRDSISKNLSVSKSITSLLTGIAVDEGYIESVHDPVTKYVPELKNKDSKFGRLTIEHLLNMRACFKFNEDNYFPRSKATRLYYGANHLGKVKRAKFKHEPGEVFEYQSLVTSLLGGVVEKATHRKKS